MNRSSLQPNDAKTLKKLGLVVAGLVVVMFLCIGIAAMIQY